MFRMNNRIPWREFDHEINSWSAINHKWFETTDILIKKKRETMPACLMNRIKNIEQVVDWWSLQNRKVTWRQASSQSQVRTWGTLSKLQTGASSICNTEEPVYSSVHTNYTHMGYIILKSLQEGSTGVHSKIINTSYCMRTMTCLKKVIIKQNEGTVF